MNAGVIEICALEQSAERAVDATWVDDAVGTGHEDQVLGLIGLRVPLGSVLDHLAVLLERLEADLRQVQGAPGPCCLRFTEHKLAVYTLHRAAHSKFAGRQVDV